MPLPKLCHAVLARPPSPGEAEPGGSVITGSARGGLWRRWVRSRSRRCLSRGLALVNVKLCEGRAQAELQQPPRGCSHPNTLRSAACTQQTAAKPRQLLGVLQGSAVGGREDLKTIIVLYFSMLITKYNCPLPLATIFSSYSTGAGVGRLLS